MLIFFLFCFIYTHKKKTDNNELCYHKFYAAKAKKKNSWQKKKHEKLVRMNVLFFVDSFYNAIPWVYYVVAAHQIEVTIRSPTKTSINL